MLSNQKITIGYSNKYILKAYKILRDHVFYTLFLFFSINPFFGQETVLGFYLENDAVISGDEIIHTKVSNDTNSKNCVELRSAIIPISNNKISENNYKTTIFISKSTLFVYINEIINANVVFQNTIEKFVNSYKLEKENKVVKKVKPKKNSVTTYKPAPFSNNFPANKKIAFHPSSAVISILFSKNKKSNNLQAVNTATQNTLALLKQNANNPCSINKVAYTLAIKYCNRPPPPLT